MSYSSLLEIYMNDLTRSVSPIAVVITVLNAYSGFALVAEGFS